jgi:Ca2+-transporting ATPase
MSATEALSLLNTTVNGLSVNEAHSRLAQYGYNELAKARKQPLWLLFLNQFNNYLIIILLAAAVLSAFVGKTIDAALIFAIVLFSGVIGFIMEYKAERDMEALKNMAALKATALRDGEETEVLARELVPGDIIVLRTGEKIPADCRLVEAINLRIEESSLTGESVPADKVSEPMDGVLSLGDRRNMAHLGTVIVNGRGKAIVVATGMATEFGKIAGMLQEVKQEPTPLQVNLNRLGKALGTAAIIFCLLIALAAMYIGFGALEMFVWAIALAVAIIPEALPAVVVLTLALAARRMIKRRALIRKLTAVETLGSVTYICSDKTGTLTQDKMTVRRIYAENMIIDVSGSGYDPRGEFSIAGEAIEPRQNMALTALLTAGTLCNDTQLAWLEDTWQIKGDPTEGALVVAAAKAGLWQKELGSLTPRVFEIPFASELKKMTTVHQTTEGHIAYSKGAPESVLNLCRYIYVNGQEEELSDARKRDILTKAQELAADALRVLGLSYKHLPVDTDMQGIEEGMVFIGLVGMIDPPREEAKAAVETCDRAGIKTIMITGDHKLTAMAIAKELGILKKGKALSGSELDSISDDELSALIEEIEVYARVSPAHKLRIVEILSQKGHIAAMTGDGVNDAPALKKAGIGVAMGITGTDVSKEAADMVLTDDNFASIVSAVEEGRTIYANIRKYLTYLLSDNAGAVLAMITTLFIGPLVFWPGHLFLPLTAALILFMNVLIDGPPAVALGIEPPEKGVMNRPPRNPRSSIFNLHTMLYIPFVGLWIAGVSLYMFIWADPRANEAYAMTMFFVTLVCLRLCNAWNCRSAEASIFRVGLLSNKWLIYSCLWSFSLLLTVLYVPFLREAFGLATLSASDWIAIVPAGFSVIAVVELQKLIYSFINKRRK